MPRKKLNWPLIDDNLEEALTELEELVAKRRSRGRIDEGELMVSLSHAFHHMNFAWNARRATASEYRHLSQAKFDEWSRYPSDLFVPGASETD